MTDSMDAARAKAKAEANRIVVRMQDELDKMIKLFSRTREAIENELMSGLGYAGHGVTDKDMKKLSTLSTMCDHLVSAKIRFDKAAKQMADTMTPGEEKAAVIAFIKSCEKQDRADIISRIKDWEAKRGHPDPTG